MNQFSMVCFPLLLCLFGERPVTSESPTYGERGSDFGIQVFQRLIGRKPDDNVVLSPHGVASILGLLLPAAHGETRRQIVNALHFKKNGPYKMLKKLHNALTAKSNQDIVTIANAMFSKQGFPMKKAVVATNKANYQCESRTLNFSDPQMAADAINTWVSNKTKGHISHLIDGDMLDPVFTKLVLVNSIYFKGLWKTRFRLENTKMGSFFGYNGRTYKVPMMSDVLPLNIGIATNPQGLSYKVMELPYHGNTTSLMIALPEENSSLSSIVPHISTETVQSWTKLMNPMRVHLSIPKFTVEAEVDLEEGLKELGVTDPFNEAKADLRNLSALPLYVCKALQKAKIVVNEDGTKASAATGAVVMTRSSPLSFSVNRPFVFLVQHKPTGTIIFMGQITQP